MTGLRNALRAHVGDASLLPSFPARPAVRVVVIDTARDAAHGLIHPGVSRHGDTLAHLIEDLVCLPAVAGRVRRCAAEVTTALALPWINNTGTVGPNGGYIGTLSDLARAIERPVLTWQQNRIDAPDSTPARLLLNLSLGWEDTPKIADCSAGDPDGMGPPARAVRGILQYAASQGALIVAAAGNDSGGKPSRPGLVCPGLYQTVKQDADPSKSLLVAVSGVDYQDHPLETVRPFGITGIAGLGLGVAWGAGDPVPPQLTGSSVSTAVASAVSALVWAHQPTWTASSVTTAVYTGGVDVQGGLIDKCPLFLDQCRSHRVSVCGALQAAGAQLSCTPAAAKPWSCPDLHVATAALAATYTAAPLKTGMLNPPPSPALLPRFTTPTVQVQPMTFPMPISDSCRTCMVAQSFNLSDTPFLYISALGQVPSAAVLAVRLAGDLPDDPPHTMGLTNLVSGLPQVFVLPSEWIVQSAYITGFDVWNNYSVTEQILVQQ